MHQILDNAFGRAYHRPNETKEGQTLSPMNKIRSSGKIFKKQGGRLFLLLTSLLLAIGCSTADLSTNKLKNPDTQKDLREKAITIFEKSLNARGGYSTHRSSKFCFQQQGTKLTTFFLTVSERDSILALKMEKPTDLLTKKGNSLTVRKSDFIWNL